MTTDGSALVLVQPNDTLEVIVAHARQTGATSVELLVPAHTSALQNWRNVGILQQALAQSGIEVMLISSDEDVLEAGREGGVTTIAIEGTSVVGPLVPQKQRSQRPAVSTPVSPPKPTRSIERDMLDLLDQGSGTPAKPVQERIATPQYSDQDADFLATLDDLGETFAQDETATRRATRAPEPPVVADRETTPIRAVAAPRSSRPAVPAPANRPHTPRRSARSEPAVDIGRRRRRVEPEDEQQAVEPSTRRRMGLSPVFIAGLVLIALFGVGAVWALNSRVSVTIGAPAARTRELPIVNEPIPYGAEASGDTPSILAAPVVADTEFVVHGQVEAQTTSPMGKAKGNVLVINTISQALSLPEGTEFVGRNPQGAEVRFSIDAPVTIPGASSSSSLTGTSITYGQANVAVTARSPGAASNIPENTVRSILIPGQTLIDCVSSNPICRNDAISGGSDEPQWIVTDADQQRVLGEALTGLYNTGVQQLRAQTNGVQSTIDASSISPSPQVLGRRESYEPPVMSPAIGQPSDTREFTMTVRTRFVALAVRPDRMLKDQLAQIVNGYLAQNGGERCTAAEVGQSKIDSWIWDGASLKINGVLQCSPRGVLGPEIRLQVRDSLRGKTRAEADAALRELQLQGLIGEYSMGGDAQQLPSLDFLIDVRFAGE